MLSVLSHNISESVTFVALMEHSYTSASGFPMGAKKIRGEGGAFQNLMGGRGGGLSQHRGGHAGLKECS